MYWKAAIIKYKEEDRIRVGILLFYSQSSEEKPVMYILGKALGGSGIKRKWMVPMKIKRWLLYDYHSYPYATRFLGRKITVFDDNEFNLTEIGKRNKLWPFDKDMIKKKFPAMTKNVFKETGKKKK
jgi:hypothetical protein